MADRDRVRQVVIGLTGPIASGKSTIARWLAERGADIIDADAVYGSLVRPGAPLLGAIADHFGPQVLRSDGALDRRALAAIVFSDSAALAALERITHPAVVAEVRRRIGASRAPAVVVEAVKLVPAGLKPDVDVLWLVTADEETRIRRLMERNDITYDEARARVASGGPVLPTGGTADLVIDTAVSLDCLRRRVDDAWMALVESHQMGDKPSRRFPEEVR